ncbi:MAG: AAA family ATPase [Thermoanaerobaculia bacterium]|nr:AAA family ATPase [Thermoanaerobaculia bacterium]
MLILLVGPKGSGKSHIGRALEQHLGVFFFHVEPLWMAFNAECAAAGIPVDISQGIRKVHPEIAAALTQHDRVCVETTGASVEILEDLLALGERHGMLRVRIEAPLSVCMERIRHRDPEHQIPMAEDMIRRVYQRSVALELPFDLIIENVGLSTEVLVARVRAAIDGSSE